MRTLFLGWLLVLGVLAQAAVKPHGGKYTVYAFLSLRPDAKPRLVINPLSRSNYVIDVQNPDFVIKQMHTKKFFDYVKVTIDLFQPVDNHALGIVTSIASADLKKPVIYDGDLHEVHPKGH